MRKFLIFTALLISLSAHAGLWPIIMSIRVDNIAPDQYNYYITQKPVEIGPSVDVVMNYKYIELTHRHFPGDITGAPTVTTKTGSSGKTLSEVAMDLYNTRGKYQAYVFHGGAAPSNNECVAYIILSVNDLYGGIPWSQVTVPGGCLVVPPAEEWCKITSPEIVLEHGTISLKQAEGNVASTSLGVQCTTGTAVTFNLITNEKYVYLDEGKSEITVDNKPLKSKIDLPQGDSLLQVKDLLTGVTNEGFHTGSSVLVMMPY